MTKVIGLAMIAASRLFLVADKSRLVAEGDPDAAFLYAAPGDEIPAEAAEQFGLVDGDLPKAKKEKPEGAAEKKPAGGPSKKPAGGPAKKPAGGPAKKPAGGPAKKPEGGAAGEAEGDAAGNADGSADDKGEGTAADQGGQA